MSSFEAAPEEKVAAARRVNGATGRASQARPHDLQTLQRLVGNRATTYVLTHAVERYAAGLDGGGQPLQHSDERFFSSMLGTDLAGVRVHSGSDASTTARALDTPAFNVGPHVVFGAGRYAPSDPAGRQLLAHELAHVAQRRLPTRSALNELNSSGDSAEVEAASFVCRPGPVHVPATALIHRNGKPPGPQPPYLKPTARQMEIVKQMDAELAQSRANAPKSSGPREEGTRTFAVTKVINAKGEVTQSSSGAFLKKGPHAEELSLKGIDMSKVTETDATYMMTDQVPCEPRCTPLLNRIRDKIRGEFRVFTKLKVDPETRQGGSPKTVATKPAATGVEYMELTEFQKLPTSSAGVAASATPSAAKVVPSGPKAPPEEAAVPAEAGAKVEAPSATPTPKPEVSAPTSAVKPVETVPAVKPEVVAPSAVKPVEVGAAPGAVKAPKIEGAVKPPVGVRYGRVVGAVKSIGIQLVIWYLIGKVFEKLERERLDAMFAEKVAPVVERRLREQSVAAWRLSEQHPSAPVYLNITLNLPYTGSKYYGSSLNEAIDDMKVMSADISQVDLKGKRKLWEKEPITLFSTTQPYFGEYELVYSVEIDFDETPEQKRRRRLRPTVEAALNSRLSAQFVIERTHWHSLAERDEYLAVYIELSSARRDSAKLHDDAVAYRSQVLNEEAARTPR